MFPAVKTWPTQLSMHLFFFDTSKGRCVPQSNLLLVGTEAEPCCLLGQHGARAGGS